MNKISIQALKKIEFQLNFALINSLEEIEQAAQDLHTFVQDISTQATISNAYIIPERIRSIEVLCQAVELLRNQGSNIFSETVVEETKKALQELSPLSTESKKKHLLIKALSHTDLISFLEHLYPKRPLDKGICHGFALMGLQAIFTGKIDQFEERLKKLAILLTNYPKHEKISKALEKIQEENDFDLLAFFEGLELCSRGYQYKDLFNEETHPRSQLNAKFIDTMLAMVASKELEEVLLAQIETEDPKKKLIEIAEMSGAYSQIELHQYFDSLQKTFKKNLLPNTPIALFIKNLNHTCVIGYDSLQNVWTYFDANFPFPQRTNDMNQLARCVAQGLNSANYRHTFMHTSVISTKSSACFWRLIFSLWKTDSQFRKIHRINPRAPIKNRGNLLLATRYNDEVSAKRLMEKKTDMNKSLPWSLYNPLFMAAAQGHIETMKALIESGADIDQGCENGETPLFGAAKEGHLESVHLLLQTGADRHKCNKKGETPLYIAEKNGHSEIVQILMNPTKKKRTDA